MKPLALIAIALVAAVVQEPWRSGKFIGEVVAKWEIDRRHMTLVEPFAYIDSRGDRWDAKVGSKVDGASIPRFAWSIIGGPFEGLYRPASVIHDVACIDRKKPWRTVHLVFYEAMLTAGVTSGLAKVMYAAVFHFGPKWEIPCDKCPAISLPSRPTFGKEEFEALKNRILQRETGATPMTLKEIERFPG